MKKLLRDVCPKMKVVGRSIRIIKKPYFITSSETMKTACNQIKVLLVDFDTINVKIY